MFLFPHNFYTNGSIPYTPLHLAFLADNILFYSFCEVDEATLSLHCLIVVCIT